MLTPKHAAGEAFSSAASMMRIKSLVRFFAFHTKLIAAFDGRSSF
jgi:hypothetical protein